MSPFFPSGGPSIGASASASVFPINTQDWFPLEWSSTIPNEAWTFVNCHNLLQIYYITLKGKLNFLFASDVDFSFQAISYSFSFHL